MDDGGIAVETTQTNLLSSLHRSCLQKIGLYNGRRAWSGMLVIMAGPMMGGGAGGMIDRGIAVKSP